MTEVRVPTLGESVSEATVATWFKKPGDSVAVDEMLCELETDKVTVEVPSPAAGTLGEIVAEEGWRGFREHEYAVVQRVSAFTGGALIDCGGGVVVDLDEAGHEIPSRRKIEALRSHALVVYLARDVDYLLSRIGADPQRPELSETEGFRDIMARRDPWFREAADLVLDCGERPKAELAGTILAWFYEQLGVDPAEARRALA